MEINTIVQRYIPEKPKVIASEQIEVYVPTANYNYPGLASFDSRGFIVDVNGKVKLRRDSLRNVKDFTVDVTTGECTIYYDDGTEATVKFPTNSETLYNRVGLMTTIDVKGSSFVRYELGEQEVEWYLILPNTSTGFNNDKYLVSFEESGNIDYAKPNETSNLKVGYFTINDSIFKGSDGSLLISISDEYYREDFSGRLLLLGGEIFTDTQILNITYSPDKHKLSIFKTDGTVDIINAVTREYVDDYIDERLSTVYRLEGTILFKDLPDTSEIDMHWVGKVWYVKDAFITDSRFLEGAYVSVPAGTNVTIVEDSGVFKYDILGSLIDLSLYYTKDEVDAIVTTTVKQSEKGVPLGIATLDENGKVPVEQLPENIGNNNNLKNGKGKGAIEQIADGVADGFAYAEYNADGSVKSYKNPTVMEWIPDDLKAYIDGGGKIPYGAEGNFSSAIGGKSYAYGKRSHAEGTTTVAFGDYSHVEGNNSATLGSNSHAEGKQTTTLGENSHAEGFDTFAEGYISHSEGYQTHAEGPVSHAEGQGTHAEGDQSHAEGNGTYAKGYYSHAEGYGTQAKGKASHASGEGTIAEGDYQTVVGRFNSPIDYINLNQTTKAHALFIVGNGTGESNEQRNLAFAVFDNGEAVSWYEHEPSSDASLISLRQFNSLLSKEVTTYLTNGRTIHSVQSRFYSNLDDSHEQSIADYEYDFVYGKGLRTTNECQVVFGKYNSYSDADWQNPKALFVVGNGYVDEKGEEIRSNAFEVKEDGTAYAGGKKLLREGEASGGSSLPEGFNPDDYVKNDEFDDKFKQSATDTTEEWSEADKHLARLKIGAVDEAYVNENKGTTLYRHYVYLSDITVSDGHIYKYLVFECFSYEKFVYSPDDSLLLLDVKQLSKVYGLRLKTEADEDGNAFSMPILRVVASYEENDNSIAVVFVEAEQDNVITLWTNTEIGYVGDMNYTVQEL